MITAIIILLTAFANYLIGSFVFLKNPGNRVNRTVAIFSWIFCAWSLSLFFYEYPLVLSSLFWIRITYLIVIFGIIGGLYYFSFIFPDGYEYPPLWGQIAFFLSASLMGAILLFSNLFVKDVVQMPWGHETILGEFYISFNIFASVFGFWGLGYLIKKYRRSVGHIRSQLRYVFLGLAFYVAETIILDSIIPMITGNSRFFSISATASLFFVGFTTYAIIKHRLLDIRMATSEITSYIVLIAMTAIICTFGAGAFWIISGTPFKWGVLLVITVVSAILSLTFGKLQSISRTIAAKYFFQTIYDYEKTLRRLSLNLASYIDMQKLIDIILKTLMDTLKVNRTALLVKDFETNQYKIQKTIGFNEDNGISLVKDNFLTSYLEKHPKIIVLDEIQLKFAESLSDFEKDGLAELMKHMVKIEATLIIPIINANRLISLIVLGSKISNDPYTVQDIELLHTIANQAGVAIENARLYKEVSVLNSDLKKRVNEATEELKKRNVDLEKANTELKSLDKMKDQLIAVTSHELRTPASIVQNYLWMVLHRPSPYTVLDEHDRKELERGLSAIQNLIKIVNGILDVSHIEAGSLTVNIVSVDVYQIIESVIADFTPQIHDKGLTIHFIKPEKLQPYIMADTIRFREIMTNLISNAIKYTKHGGIVVRVTAEAKSVIVQVKDTGRGIAPEHLEQIFSKFYREDASLTANTLETGGTGLGLFITRALIELMHGSISVESEVNKGTTFTFQLPLAATKPLKVTLTHFTPGRIPIVS